MEGRTHLEKNKHKTLFSFLISRFTVKQNQDKCYKITLILNADVKNADMKARKPKKHENAEIP
jgi:hypothetical protein